MKINAYTCPSCGAPLDVNYDTRFTFCPNCGCKLHVSYEGEAAPQNPELSLTTTTIGQFSPEISALADKTPTALVYTESIGSPGTFSTVVDDPAMAKKVLDIILSASVTKLGCQVDMAQMQYVEYRFDFGEESFTFHFIPHSYFCYNGQDYELRENRLRSVCDSLHEMTEEPEAAMEPQSE